jgi:hypothetical protein
MLGTPKALGQAIEGKAVSRRNPRAKGTAREKMWWQGQKELWPIREK